MIPSNIYDPSLWFKAARKTTMVSWGLGLGGGGSQIFLSYIWGGGRVCFSNGIWGGGRQNVCLPHENVTPPPHTHTPSNKWLFPNFWTIQDNLMKYHRWVCFINLCLIDKNENCCISSFFCYVPLINFLNRQMTIHLNLKEQLYSFLPRHAFW